MQIALITGATSGIGQATAYKLASRGYSLILTGRRSHRLETIKREIARIYPEAQVLLGVFDIRDQAAVTKFVRNLPESWQDIDVLINNAGLAAGLDFLNEGDTDDWDRMVDTNVKGLLYISRLVTPGMVTRHKGHIVNIGSIAGRETYEKGAVYCASKHAVNAITQGMRIDLLRHGIRVSQVRPGMVDTEFSKIRFHGDQERADAVYQGVQPLTAEDIADTIDWILSQPPHVNINDVEIMPQQQADAFYTFRHPAE